MGRNLLDLAAGLRQDVQAAVRHRAARQGDVDTVVGELVCERCDFELSLALRKTLLELLPGDVEVLAGLAALLGREGANIAQCERQRRAAADRGDADLFESRKIRGSIDLRERVGEKGVGIDHDVQCIPPTPPAGHSGSPIRSVKNRCYPAASPLSSR